MATQQRNFYQEDPEVVTNYILLLGSELGDTELIRWALKKGVDPNDCFWSSNDRDGDEDSPLSKAVILKHHDAVRVLLEAGAKYTDEDSMNPLEDAIKNHDEPMVRLLLEHPGAVNVNSKSYKKLLTPLHIAASYGFMCICKLLLAYGADLQAKTKDGKMPRDLAKDEIIKAYLDNYKPESDPEPALKRNREQDQEEESAEPAAKRATSEPDEEPEEPVEPEWSPLPSPPTPEVVNLAEEEEPADGPNGSPLPSPPTPEVVNLADDDEDKDEDSDDEVIIL